MVEREFVEEMQPSSVELPTGWAQTTIGSITQEIAKVDPTTYPDLEFVYIDISAIDNSRNVVVEPKLYRGREAPSRARQLVQAHDVLFSTVRTYLKNIAQVPEIYDGQVASTGFSVLRPEQGVSSKYLFYRCLDSEFLASLEALQRGTSYPAIRDSDMRDQVIPLPPTNEQHRIVDAIEEQFSRLDAGIVALKRAQLNLKRYKDSVLKAACEGKLVPQDLNDEPAEKLLERILARKRFQRMINGRRNTPNRSRWIRRIYQACRMDG
jgi:type I restriction enzyme, S subunit